jgi:uncharacterized protein YkwD
LRNPTLSLIFCAALASSPLVAQDMTSRICPSADTIRQEIVGALKAARSEARSCGGKPFGKANPLAWNPNLAKAAKQHAGDMTRKGYFSHNSPGGGSPGDRITAAGYAWRTYGENIALGQETVEQVMQEWLSSPQHCSNIMNQAFTQIGAACATGAGQPHWVMVLGAPLRKSGK